VINRSTETIWNGEKSSWKTPSDSGNAFCDWIGTSSKLHLHPM